MVCGGFGHGLFVESNGGMTAILGFGCAVEEYGWISGERCYWQSVFIDNTASRMPEWEKFSDLFCRSYIGVGEFNRESTLVKQRSPKCVLLPVLIVSNYLKTCSARFSQSPECLISAVHPELLWGMLEVSSCSITGFNPCRNRWEASTARANLCLTCFQWKPSNTD